MKGMENSKMAKQYFKVCCCCWRLFELGTAKPPEDVKQVFELYSENGSMDVDHLHKFLTESQGETSASNADAHSIYNSLKHLNIFHRKGLHLQGFLRYLFSDHNLALPSHGVHHDMNAPLPHYFLYTGHNSYLSGNQLTSDSSVKPIIMALKQGLRVIELDLWPNATKDDVDVRHGGWASLTTPVDLIDCLHAIKEHAFEASEYPVVITFEDHLTPDLRAKVAQMVTETFGSMLFRPGRALEVFPSPEKLKKKIMISTKPPKEYLEALDISEQGTTQNAKDLELEEPWEKENQGIESDPETGLSQDSPDEGEDHQGKNLHRVPPEYGHLIAIHAGKLNGKIERMLTSHSSKVRRLSLSEEEFEDLAETKGTHIVRFTQRNLLRIYPKGMRVDSSNYNPLLGWMHGAQMVALNMQGHGKYLWMMQGMFRANGGCGYVKKPSFLLDGDKIFDPLEELPPKTTLKVKFYMGEGWRSEFARTHFDLYSPPDFYARVGIAGVPYDTTEMKRTEAVEDQWVPMWNEEFEFPLSVPELALLRIEVKEYDFSKQDDFGGQTCLPVSELRTGIRAVPLCHRKGDQYKFVRLLMRFTFE